MAEVRIKLVLGEDLTPSTNVVTATDMGIRIEGPDDHYFYPWANILSIRGNKFALDTLLGTGL